MTTTMRAIRWHGRGDVRPNHVPVPPSPGPGEVRVAVAWTGICGTDREEWRHGPLFIPGDAPHPLTGVQAPLTMGHEMAGHAARVALEDTVEMDFGAVGRSDLPGVKVLVSPNIGRGAHG